MCCMVRHSSDTTFLDGIKKEYVYGDFTCPATLPEAVKGMDEIYHLGGTVRVVDKKRFYDINTDGTGYLVDAVRKHNPDIEKFVYVSSQAAAGPGGKGPVSEYGKSKKAGEKKVRNIKRYSILRPVAVYGPRDRDFLSIFKMAQKGIFLKPAGAGRLSFIHVKDCVEGIASVKPGEEKYLSDGNNYSWENVAKVLKKVIKEELSIVVLPKFIIKLAGEAGSAKAKITGKAAVLNRDKAREIIQDWAVEDKNSKAKFSLYEGFTDTYNWYKRQGWL